MLPGQPSRTLILPAITRAAHQLLDTPLILNDPIAVGLLPETSSEAILGAVADHRTYEAAAGRALFTLRNRFAEDRLALAASRGTVQFVMLGAGLETFPWRQPNFARNMRIFFVDHPSTLAWAQDRFRERKLATPPNVSFVSADLDERCLGGRLRDAGFIAHAPTFVSMLGVMQYLRPETIDFLFEFFVSLCPGSEVVFSFIVPDDELGELERIIIRGAMERGNSRGEPWYTRARPAEMIVRVSGRGFRNVYHLSPEMAQQQYFAGRQDELRAPYREQLIAATI